MVRAVRGGSTIANRFVDNGNGTVTDRSTGLMWQKSTDSGAIDWEQAIYYCEDLDHAGYSDCAFQP